MPATMAVGQHAVRVSKSIPVQKWNSPKGGQVHYTDAAVVASNDCECLSSYHSSIYVPAKYNKFLSYNSRMARLIQSSSSRMRINTVNNINRRRRSGLAGAGLSLYACLISHFNIVNIHRVS